MLLKKYRMLLLFLLVLAIPSLADAANLRGRIDAANRFSRVPYPLGRAVVDLCFGRNKTRYITGPDGMYYFGNIFPGRYVLEINGRLRYPITVGNQPYQDLPPIVLRY